MLGLGRFSVDHFSHYLCVQHANALIVCENESGFFILNWLNAKNEMRIESDLSLAVGGID